MGKMGPRVVERWNWNEFIDIEFLLVFSQFSGILFVA